LGMERLVIALEAKNAFPSFLNKPLLFLAPLGKQALDLLFPLSLDLKRSGLFAECSYDSQKSLKSQLKLANKLQFRFCLILGEDELKKKVALLKDMDSQTQTEIQLENILKTLIEKVTREN